MNVDFFNYALLYQTIFCTSIIVLFFAKMTCELTTTSLWYAILSNWGPFVVHIFLICIHTEFLYTEFLFLKVHNTFPHTSRPNMGRHKMWITDNSKPPTGVKMYLTISWFLCVSWCDTPSDSCPLPVREVADRFAPASLQRGPEETDPGASFRQQQSRIQKSSQAACLQGDLSRHQTVLRLILPMWSAPAQQLAHCVGSWASQLA